jgi:hypothetical protein
MRKMVPWLGILLAVVGICKSVLRKARFVQNYRYRGWLAPRKFTYGDVYDYYFMIRIGGEQYFTYSMMYVPVKVRDSVVSEVSGVLEDKYRGDLGGAFIRIIESVPHWSTEIRPGNEGYRRVKEDYQFNTFCKRHGVRVSRVIWVMNEYRREFYRRLVYCGEMREDELL